MAIGPIVSPASWANGTVAAPIWFQSVQDNQNGWIAGTGPTLRSLQIDGTGGASSVTPAGNLQVSGTISATALSSGTITSTTATARKLWIPGGAWRDFGSSYTYNNFGMAASTTVTNQQIRAAVQLPYSTGTTTITGVQFTLSKNTTISTTVTLYQFNAINNSGVETVTASTTVNVTGVSQSSLGVLSAVVSDTVQYTLQVTSPASGVVSDMLLGALITYTTTVF